MTKRNQDFSMFAGDTKDIVVTMSDSTNLTGATIAWVLRRGGVTGTVEVPKSTTSGISISNTTFTVRLSASDTANLKGRYYHEAEVTDVSGNVSTVMTGSISIEPSGV